MTPERWKQVERIYQEALDIDPATRSEFIDQACEGDSGLRREVVSLLEAHEPDSPFLESPAIDVAVRTLAAEGPQLSAGQHLGPYELIALIGNGAMGEVWRANDPALNRPVAIKVLLSEFSRDSERLKRFKQEAQAAGMLSHPNILTVYAIGEEADLLYMVTELLEGSTLRERLAEGPIPEAKAIEYASQIAQGLAVAHEKGIVHRDLKPENIFVTRDGLVKILDFGLAKLLPPGPTHKTLTAPGMVVGTPAYMSPEQVRGQPTDVRSDIFSLGVILHEMLSGRQPFSGESAAETMTAVLKNETPPVPQSSPVLEQIVRHCLEKDPGQRFQSVRDLSFQLRLLLHPSAQNMARRSPAGISHPIAWGLAALAFVATGMVVTWYLTQQKNPNLAPVFTQLTFDTGLTTDPALSADGKLLAYASDRSGAGNLDIWLQQVGSREAIRLTKDPSDDSDPSFSPDGTRIAFRSERRGGGIYVVSALGGAETLIAPQGRAPRFSRDGSRIAYWVGYDASRVHLVASTGGPAMQFPPDFGFSRFPIWSPDGKHVLFLGCRGQEAIAPDMCDWWIAPLNGGAPIKTEILPFLRKHGLPDPGARTLMPGSVLIPRAWTGDNQIIFAADTGDSRNLWQVAISPANFAPADIPRRLTSGAGPEDLPSTSDGSRIAYANVSANIDLWGLVLDPRRSEPQRLTENPTLDIQPAISADGSRLVFASNRAGNYDIWGKDLPSGAETALTISPAFESKPAISADGSRVAYNDWTGGKPILNVAPWGGHSGDGLTTTVCREDCYLPWEWSRDNRYLLYWPMDRRRVGLLDVASGQKSIVLEHPEFAVLRPTLSGDGRWIAFDAIRGGDRVQVLIAPFQGMSAAKSDTWIAVTKADTTNSVPRWSQDGNTLFFTSERDGYRCLWRQRLDLKTKQPVGEAQGVYHIHGARRSLSGVPGHQLDIAIAGNKLVFPMSERTGNIWMVQWKH